jgi:hypothetical protein
MNKINCQKFTSALSDFKGLKKKVDLALHSFRPDIGNSSKNELVMELEKYKYSRIQQYFSTEAYDDLVRVLGGEKELASRFKVITTSGKNGDQLYQEMQKDNCDFSPEVDKMLGSMEFEVVPPDEKVALVTLTGFEIFGNRNERTYKATIQEAARKFGLDYCPHEIAADLMIAGIDETYRTYGIAESRDLQIVSRPIIIEGIWPRTFSILIAEYDSFFGSSRFNEQELINSRMKYVFAVNKNAENVPSSILRETAYDRALLEEE